MLHFIEIGFLVLFGELEGDRHRLGPGDVDRPGTQAFFLFASGKQGEEAHGFLEHEGPVSFHAAEFVGGEGKEVDVL